VYPTEGEYLVVDTTFGYLSSHHIFPSNWKDVPDSTILVTTAIVFFIPILMNSLFVSYSPIRLFIYFFFIFAILAIFTHKYAHEKLHGRYVPFIIDILIKSGISLSPTNHQKHHIENNYNWAFLSGKTDGAFNLFVKLICRYLNTCPMEETTKNVKKQQQVENVKIKFIGDIEHTLECKLENNLYLRK
jgi:hypothetical protein